MNTVIVYGTNYGTSEKVAQILGEQIAGAVELVNVDDINKMDLAEVDKLIIGCGIKIGKIPKNLKNWLDNFKNEILEKEIYIYMCAGEKEENKIKELFNNNFPKEILEKSKYTVCVGGEINLSRLKFFMKLIFKIIQESNGKIGTLDRNKIFNLAQAINLNNVKEEGENEE